AVQSDQVAKTESGSEKPQDPGQIQSDAKARVDDPPPKRGSLRIARLKHAGDWDIAPKAIPNLTRALRQLPLNMSVVIAAQDLHGRDPSLVYSSLVSIQGRAAFVFSKADRDVLRNHLDPGGGTLVADAYLGSPAFDASFRRFVAELLPNEKLVPIPKD